MFQKRENIFSEGTRLSVASSKEFGQFSPDTGSFPKTYIGSRVLTSHGFKSDTVDGSKIITRVPLVVRTFRK